MGKSEQLVVSIVELLGSYHQFGVKQGKELMSSPLLEHVDLLHELTADANVSTAKNILNKFSPSLLQELKGLAEGLEMEFDTVIKLFSGYDIAFPEMGCTTLVNNGYYVRNYDYSPDLYDARLVFTNPTDGYASVGFSQQVIGRLDGMNEKGLVVGLHFVNNEHREEGFISTTIVRILLEQCADIKEAIEMITSIPHGYCYNYSLTDQSGKSVMVEATPEQQIVHFNNPLVCTNHFVSEALQAKNRKGIEEGSVKRKENATDLLAEDLSPMSLYHRFNCEHSPLFFHYYKEFFGTLHTVVYSPKDLTLIVGVGGNSEPLTFSLKDYMDGTLTLPETIKGTIHQAKGD